MPHDLPPWPVVYQPMRRWMAAGSLEASVHDLRGLLRRAAERKAQPSAAMLDSRTIQSTPERGARAGDDGHQRRKGSKIHAAVDTLGPLLALVVTPADEQDRAQVGDLAQALQAATGATMELAFVDQGDTADAPAEPARARGRALAVVKLPEAQGPKVPSGASCCCLNAGWLHAIARGRRASGAWLETMSGSPPPWLACIFWPSPVSCFSSSLS